MKLLALIMLALVSQLAEAYSGRSTWKRTDDKGKAELIRIYQQYFAEASQAEPMDEWQEKRTSFLRLIPEAWAADGAMDCIYAGWPSRRNGSCSSPSRANPDYQQGDCKTSEMQCQPMLFGKGLCVSVASAEARSSAFSQCNKKFQAAGRDATYVVAEMKSEGKEAQLLSLLDFADKVCRDGAQKGTGMCKRLQEQVSKVRSELEKVMQAAVQVVNNLTSTLAVASRQPMNCAQETELVINGTTELVTVKSDELVDIQPLVLDPVTEVEEVEEVEESENDPVTETPPDAPEDDLIPFASDRPREDIMCPRKTAKSGDAFRQISSLSCSNRDAPAVYSGVSFETDKNSPYFRQGAGIHSQMSRSIDFQSGDGSKRETYLYVSEEVMDSDSYNVKSIIVLLPRKTIPHAETVGDEFRVTLPTGEVVVYDKATKVIKRGALKEGEMDLNPNRFERKPPNVQYSGSGISIRVNHRYEHPTSSVGDPVAKVSQNGRTCNVPRARIWDSEGRALTTDDQQLVNVLNQACPARGGEKPFGI